MHLKPAVSGDDSYFLHHLGVPSDYLTFAYASVFAPPDCGLREGCRSAGAKTFDPVLADTDKPIPPRIAAEEINKRQVISSDKNITPPRAAMTGTASCTVAARVAVNPVSAAYQMT